MEEARQQSKEEGRQQQSSKPKSNPFGAAKPVTVKYGELEKAPSKEEKEAAEKEKEDEGATPVDKATEALSIN